MVEKNSIEPLVLKNKDEWIHWLKLNHHKKKEIWLIIKKKGVNRKGISYDDAVDAAICYGWIDSKMYRINNKVYGLRFSPRKSDSPWSMLNRKRAEKMIASGEMNISGFKKIEEAKRNGRWNSAYTSKVKPIIPSDLKNALKVDNVSWKNFNNFSNSHQLQYIYWLNNAKRLDTRKKRIDEIVKRANQNITPGN